MSHRILAVVAMAAAGIAAALVVRSSPDVHAALPADTVFPIPSSIRDEHSEVTALLLAATGERGPVGEAARELQSQLAPHLEREEQIALPPLGALAALAAGPVPRGADALVPLADSLRAEWPRMMEEHRRIRTAVDQLEAVAGADGMAEKYAPLVGMLRHHALMEEEILYPAAILVGDAIRARRPAR